MQGANALKNMNLGSTLESVLNLQIETSIANANYPTAAINKFTDYTNGKTLEEYVAAKVREGLSLPAGADIWVTADGKTPLPGSLEAINASADVAEKAGPLADAALAALYDLYKADSAATTTTDEVTTEVTTETPTQIVVVGGTTTPAAGTTQVPAATDKPEEKSCGGFAAVAAVAAVVIASLSCAIVIKKN